jgi:dTDP-4-dehydrorhamnose reductase
MSVKVAVLGATGMLGRQVLATLRQAPGLDVVATCRPGSRSAGLPIEERGIRPLDASATDVGEMLEAVGDCAWWVNCIGLIKPFIHDDNPNEVREAIRVNSLFPAILAQAAGQAGAHIIQISTDCVWDGRDGGYSEGHHHNATDVYGKSKSLGEIDVDACHTIRCSIIGRLPGQNTSLLDWFLSQPEGATVKGFTNHHWNGVTTLQFARVCEGIIRTDFALPILQHLVPADQVTKHDLLRMFARHFGRADIRIEAFETDVGIDRTIATEHEDINRELWRCGGFDSPPTIEESVAELARACA